MATLIIVRGHVGAGKSTFAKRAFPGALLIENDMFLMEDGVYKWSPEKVKVAVSLCMKMAKLALENKSDVVIANTFTKLRYIEAYSKLASEAGASFKVYRCNGNFKNVHNVSDSIVQNFKDSMEDFPGEVLVDPV
jgi:predicted kinase